VTERILNCATPRATLASILAVLVLSGSASVSAQGDFVAPRYVSGDLPAPPVLGVSGGEVFLEVVVGADGTVASIRTLRTTPPFTEATIEAVRGWSFTPAMQAIPPSAEVTPPTEPVSSPVFVAAMFAPPALEGPTLGEPPRDVQPASADVPMPISAKRAGYPPRAVSDGTALVEVTVDDAGVVTEARIDLSSPAFDEAAIGAARAWSFRPARRDGRAIITRAYLIFAFQQPVTGP
jgi:TonB family protein